MKHHISIRDPRIDSLAIEDVAAPISRLSSPMQLSVERSARHPDDVHRKLSLQRFYRRAPYLVGRPGDRHGEPHPTAFLVDEGHEGQN